MESMGTGAGYRCRKCSYKNKNLTKEKKIYQRKISTGLYIPPPRAQRHLTKPLKRYGKEKRLKHPRVFPYWYSKFVSLED
jgi:tRNA(Ile2)-agmatinylcytidine synthase